MTGVVLIGGGGHCHSCIDVVLSTGKFEIVGILDNDAKPGEKLFGIEVLGGDEKIAELNEYQFLITVGHIRTPEPRVNIFNRLQEAGAKLATVVSPHARVAYDAEIGKGSIVMHGSVVCSGAKVGENCILNNQSLVEHDAIVGSHTHVSTGTIVNGDCVVGEQNFIGSGTVLKNGIRIGNRCMISFASRVNRDIEDNEFYK